LSVRGQPIIHIRSVEGVEQEKKELDKMLFKQRYPVLDLIRALAITLVMLYHFNAMYFRLPAETLPYRFFNWGWHGVDLFFVLSGFLIGGQILEENYAGNFSFKRFYIKRTLRIFPAYYAAVLVFIAVSSFAAGHFLLAQSGYLRDVLAHLFYFQNYIRMKQQIYGGI